LDTAADRIAHTVRQLFRDGKFISSLEYVTEAAKLAPDHMLLQAVRACALLLRGEHDNEARTLFMSHRGKTVGGVSWEDFVRGQFVELRKIGCARPLMDEIERRFAGTEVSVFAESDVPPARETPDLIAVLANASDIESAEKLEKEGMFELAIVVYGRCLEECAAKKIWISSKGLYDNKVMTASSKLADLSAAFLAERNFEKALEAIDLALSATQSPDLEIRRAHVLMFLDRAVEAKELYLRHQATRVRDQITGADAVKADFDALRRHDLTHPLMAEIETLLARKVSR
jgi:hypothetical protein